MRDVASLYKNLKADKTIVPLYRHVMIVARSSVVKKRGGRRGREQGRNRRRAVQPS